MSSSGTSGPHRYPRAPDFIDNVSSAFKKIGAVPSMPLNNGNRDFVEVGYTYNDMSQHVGFEDNDNLDRYARNWETLKQDYFLVTVCRLAHENPDHSFNRVPVYLFEIQNQTGYKRDFIAQVVIDPNIVSGRHQNRNNPPVLPNNPSSTVRRIRILTINKNTGRIIYTPNEERLAGQGTDNIPMTMHVDKQIFVKNRIIFSKPWTQTRDFVKNRPTTTLYGDFYGKERNYSFGIIAPANIEEILKDLDKDIATSRVLEYGDGYDTLRGNTPYQVDRTLENITTYQQAIDEQCLSIGSYISPFSNKIYAHDARGVVTRNFTVVNVSPISLFQIDPRDGELRRIYHRDPAHWINERPYYIYRDRDWNYVIFSYNLDIVEAHSDGLRDGYIGIRMKDISPKIDRFVNAGSILTVRRNESGQYELCPLTNQPEREPDDSRKILYGDFLWDMFGIDEEHSGFLSSELINFTTSSEIRAVLRVDDGYRAIVIPLLTRITPAHRYDYTGIIDSRRNASFGHYINYAVKQAADLNNYAVQNQCGITFSFGVSANTNDIYHLVNPEYNNSGSVVVSIQPGFRPYYNHLITSATPVHQIENHEVIDTVSIMETAGHRSEVGPSFERIWRIDGSKLLRLYWNTYQDTNPPILGYDGAVVSYQVFNEFHPGMLNPDTTMRLAKHEYFIENAYKIPGLASQWYVTRKNYHQQGGMNNSIKSFDHPVMKDRYNKNAPVLEISYFDTEYGPKAYVTSVIYNANFPGNYAIGYMTKSYMSNGVKKYQGYLDYRFIDTLPKNLIVPGLDINDTNTEHRAPFAVISGPKGMWYSHSSRMHVHVVGYAAPYSPETQLPTVQDKYRLLKEPDGNSPLQRARTYLAITGLMLDSNAVIRTVDDVLVSKYTEELNPVSNVYTKYNGSDIGAHHELFNPVYPPVVHGGTKSRCRDRFHYDKTNSHGFQDDTTTHSFSVFDYGQSYRQLRVSDNSFLDRSNQNKRKHTYLIPFNLSGDYSSTWNLPPANVQIKPNQIRYITAMNGNRVPDYARNVDLTGRNDTTSVKVFYVATILARDARKAKQILHNESLYQQDVHFIVQAQLVGNKFIHIPIHISEKYIEENRVWNGTSPITDIAPDDYGKHYWYTTFLTDSELEQVIRNLGIGLSQVIHPSKGGVFTKLEMNMDNRDHVYIHLNAPVNKPFPILGGDYVERIAMPAKNITIERPEYVSYNYVGGFSNGGWLFSLDDNVGTDIIYTRLPNGQMGWSYPFLRKFDVSGTYSEYTSKFILETPDVSTISNLPMILMRMNKLFHSLPNKVNSNLPVISRKRYFSPISMRHRTLKYRMMYDFDINNLTLDGTYRLRYPIKLNPDQDAEFAMIPYSNPSMYEAGRDSNIDALSYYITMSNHHSTSGRDVVMIPDDRFPYCDQILFRDVSENQTNGPRVRLGDLYSEMMFTQISQSVQSSGRRYATYFDFATNLIGTNEWTRTNVTAIDFFVPNWNTRESLVDSRVFSPLRTSFYPRYGDRTYSAIGVTSAPKQHRSPESYMLNQFHYPGITGDVARENSRYTVPVMVKPGDGLQFRKVNLEVRDNEADVRAVTGDQCWIVNQSQMKEIIDMNISKKYLTDNGVPRLFNSPTDKLAVMPFGTLHGKYFKINMKPGEYICPAINGGNALASVINISTSGYYELWFGEGDYIITNLAMLDDRKFNFVTFDPNVTNSIVTCIIHPNARFIIEGNLAVSNQDVQYMVQTPSDKIETNQAWLVPYGPFSLKNNFFIRSPDNQSLVQFEPRHHSQVTEDSPYKWKTNGLNLWVDDFLIPE